MFTFSGHDTLCFFRCDDRPKTRTMCILLMFWSISPEKITFKQNPVSNGPTKVTSSIFNSQITLLKLPNLMWPRHFILLRFIITLLPTFIYCAHSCFLDVRGLWQAGYKSFLLLKLLLLGWILSLEINCIWIVWVYRMCPHLDFPAQVKGTMCNWCTRAPTC